MGNISVLLQILIKDLFVEMGWDQTEETISSGRVRSFGGQQMGGEDVRASASISRLLRFQMVSNGSK